MRANLISLSLSLSLVAATVVSATTTCDITNWNDYNTVINWADKWILGKTHGLVQALASKINPLSLGDLHFHRVSLNALNHEWDFDASVDSVTMDGLDTIYINPISLASSTAFNLGGSFSTLSVKDAAISVIITQKSFTLLGHEFCLARKFWTSCEPRTLKFKASLILEDPSLSAAADIKVMSCGGAFFDKLLCRIKSSYEFIKSLTHGGPQPELLLRRINSVNINNTQIRFNNMKLIALVIDGETNIEKELIDFAVTIVNEITARFGFIHGHIEEAASSTAEAVVNGYIADMAASFQSQCI